MPSAREKAMEREAFYRQLGETAKLSHTFVNPKAPNGTGYASPNDQLNDPAARHTAPPMTVAPQPMRFDADTVGHFTAELARLPQADTHARYFAHQAQPPYPPHQGPPTSIYSSPQPSASGYEPQSLRNQRDAHDWEQSQRGMQVPLGDIHSYIAAEVQRHLGQACAPSLDVADLQRAPQAPPQGFPYQPPGGAGVNDEDRIALQRQVEQYKAEADEVRADLRLAKEKADSAVKHQSQMAKSNAELERKFAQVDNALKEEREVNRNLRRRLDDAETHSRKEVEETKKRLNNAVNEKHNLNERLSLATVEKEKSHDKVKMMRFDNKALDAQNVELRQRKTALERQVSALSTQKDDLARQLAAVEAQLQKALNVNGQLEQEHQDLRHQIARLRERPAPKSPQTSGNSRPDNVPNAVKIAQTLHELQFSSGTSDPYDLGSAFQ